MQGTFQYRFPVIIAHPPVCEKNLEFITPLPTNLSLLSLFFPSTPSPLWFLQRKKCRSGESAPSPPNKARVGHPLKLLLLVAISDFGLALTGFGQRASATNTLSDKHQLGLCAIRCSLFFAPAPLRLPSKEEECRSGESNPNGSLRSSGGGASPFLI